MTERQAITDSLAKQWFALANGQQIELPDVFFRFIALWVSFNALYTSRHSSIRGDHARVKAYYTDDTVTRRHEEMLCSSGYCESIGILQCHGIIDCKTLIKYEITSVSDVGEIFECVYTIRNNLFHGDKSPGDGHDMKVVEAAYEILREHVAADLGVNRT